MTIADLDPARLRSALGTQRVGRSLEVRARTRSTNDDARAAALEGASAGHVIVADAQEAGRGARGRSWSSPAGVDLYLSVVERVSLAPARVPGLTLAVGLAVAEVLDRFAAPLAAEVKWPNDTLLDGRKVAGILVEGTSSGGRMEALVVGIGLNVNREGFPEDLPEATSLRLATGRAFSRAEVLVALLERLEVAVDTFVAEGGKPPVAALEARLAYRGRRVRVDDEEGILLGLDASGALRLDAGPDRPAMTVRAGTLRPL